MKKPIIPLLALVAGAQLALAVDPNHDYSDRRAPSPEAPIDNPPMLIALSSDDNFDIDGMKWMIETLKNRKHRDGSNVRMSFYCNTGFKWLRPAYVDSLYGTFLEAYKMGNEVTSHTATHPFCVKDGERLSDTVLLDEVNTSIEDLASIGIKKEHMYGFRTPYVAYTDSTFIAVKQAGFTYDASLCDGIDLEPGKYNWPYTLDTKNSDNLNEDGLENPPGWWHEATQGPAPKPAEPSYAPGNHLALSYHNQVNDAPVRRHSGLWELPLYALQVPDSLLAPLDSSLGYSSGGKVIATVETLVQQGGFTKEQALETLKHHFKLTYNGNRAPFVLVFHTPNFSTTNHEFDHLYPNCSDPRDRQWIVEQFIDFALEQEDVWFVSGEQVINYCKNPVSVDAFKPDDFTDIPIDPTSSIAKATKVTADMNNVVSVVGRSLHLSLSNISTAKVTITNMRGQQIGSTQVVQLNSGNGIVGLENLRAAGVYIATIQAGNKTISHKFSF